MFFFSKKRIKDKKNNNPSWVQIFLKVTANIFDETLIKELKPVEEDIISNKK